MNDRMKFKPINPPETDIEVLEYVCQTLQNCKLDLEYQARIGMPLKTYDNHEYRQIKDKIDSSIGMIQSMQMGMQAYAENPALFEEVVYQMEQSFDEEEENNLDEP